MKLAEKIRNYWHNLYYFFASDDGVKFARTCKEVTELIDLGGAKSVTARLRLFLHVTLCQACKNYLALSNELAKAMRGYISITEKPLQLEQLNKKLLEIYSHKHTNKQL